jgi:hypothetical protein
MKTQAMTAMLVAACAAGCTPSYRVHVNTYAEPGTSVSPGVSIYVTTDPNAANPILTRSIEAKIRELLEGCGYNPVKTRQAGDYLLTFRAGLDSERVLEYAPLYRPRGGFYGGHFGRWGLGYTMYQPYVDTVYTHWLRMRLLAKDGGTTNGENVVWVGEAITGTDDPELREAVNYLLVGCMEYFPEDTGKWVTERIREDDPRILAILEGGG